MLLIDRLAEEQINAAIRRGEFDELEGEGKPLRMENESFLSDELRVAYRMLRNADCLPPELSLRREISELEGLLHRADCTGERKTIQGKLSLLKTRLAGKGRESSLLLQDQIYRDKLLCRIAGHS